MGNDNSLIANGFGHFPNLHKASQKGRRVIERTSSVMVEAMEARVLLTAATWIGGTGNWNVASNWSTGAVPGNNDTVTINSGAVVSISDGEDPSAITTAAGSTIDITSTGSLTLGAGGTFAGTLNDGGVFNGSDSSTAPAVISGTMNVIGQFNLGYFSNTGTTNLTGASASSYRANLTNSGTLNISQGPNLSSATITNVPGGTIAFTDDVPLLGFGTIINTGTITKSGGTGTSVIPSGGTLEDLGGTIEAQTGTLSIASSFYAENTNFIASAGAAVSYDGYATGASGYSNTMDVDGTLTGSGAGNLLLTNGSITPGGNGFQPTSAVFNFPAGFVQVTAASFFDNGGAVGEITNNGFLEFAGNGAHPGIGMINDGTLDVTGTGDLQVNTSSFTNEASGIINFETDANITNPGVNAGGFTNMGLIEKTNGSGTSTIGTGTNGMAFYNNNGTFDVESGTLSIANGTQSFAFTIPEGGIVAAPGATFNLGAETVNYNIYLQGNLTVTGGGSVTQDGAYLDGPNSNDGQTSTTPSTLDFTGDQFTENGGGFGDNVNLINQGDLDFYSGDLGAILNQGTVTVGAGVVRSGSEFINAVGGALLFSGANQVLALGNNGNIQNAGTIAYSPGTGNTFDMSQVEVGNTGTIIFGPGTTNLPWISNQYVQAPELFPSRDNIPAGSTFVLQGGATVTIDTSPSITQINGTVILNSGSSFPAIAGLNTITGKLSVLSGESFVTTGSLLNNGTLSVGGSFTVNGAYNQSTELNVTSPPTPTLDFEVAAAPGVSGAPLLNVTGSTTLSGDLTADYVNGFNTTGGAYTVATFASASTGSFTSTSGTGPFFTPTISTSQIVLNGAAFTGTGGSSPGGPAIPTGGTGGGGGGTTTGSAVDLSVTSVSTPANFVAGQSETLTWTVTNNGSNAAAGTWQDSVFLSTDGTLSSDDILLGRVIETGPLAAAGTYTGTLTVDMPAVVPGRYQVIVVADSREVLNDTNRANNIAASAAATDTIPALTSGSTYNGSTTASQQQLFSLTLPGGDDSKLAATLADALEANIYISFGAIPTAQSYDQAATDPNQTTANFLLTPAQAGTYYVLVYARPDLTSSETFTLSPGALPYGPAAISPSSSANSGEVTVTINGAGFTPSTSVSLVGFNGSTETIPASQVTFVSSNQLYAEFSLSTATNGSSPATAGTYTLQTSEGSSGPTASLQGAFTINAAGGGSNVTAVGADSPGNLVYSLSAPTLIRSGAGVLTLFYENAGGTDIPAPLFDITSNNAQFLLSGQSGSYVPDSIEALGINPTGPAGTLTPGASGTITIDFEQVTTGAHVVSKFDAAVLNPSMAINWDSLKAGLNPGEQDDAWSEIYSNFENKVGTTVGQYQAALDNDATYLGEQGDRTYDESRLLNYELLQAGSFGTIAHQYSYSAFGRGQSDPFNAQLTADTAGDVFIVSGDSSEDFQILPTGGYQASLGSSQTLTLSGGIYTLTESNGSMTVFNSNGTVNYFEDAAGNKMTATETAESVSYRLEDVGGAVTTASGTFNLITSLSSASAGTTNLTYNSEGLCTQIVDGSGNTTTYTYDSTTENLLTVTTAQGTTTYAYGDAASFPHAVTSITYPDGTQSLYEYDSSDRVILETGAGGIDPIKYEYDAEGNVGTVDADGQANETLWGEDGSVAGIIDGSGQHETYTYNAAAQVTTVTNFDGTQTSIAYNAAGDEITATDADGISQSATYGSNPNDPLTRTDADKNTTTFTYNPAGEVLTESDPSKAVATYTYNTTGELVTATTAAARAVTDAYNSQGLLISEAFSDGTSSSYTYNATGDMLTATSAAGTEDFTYDSAGDLIKVIEPNGLSLSYTYNPGGLLASETDQTGFVTKYTYNAAGQLSQLTNAQDVPTATYTYDSAGNLTRTDLGNGDATAYTYNADGQIASLINYGPDSTVLSQFVYTYNTDGDIATCTSLAGLTTYTYDADGQLIKASLPGGEVLTFNYDPEGNRTSIVDSGTTTNYTVNNLNQYTSVGAATYQYDADGNLVSSTNNSGTTTYGYDVQDRLISIDAPGTTTTYTYDALGNRISTTVNGITTDNLIDPVAGNNIAGEFATSGSVIDHYTYGVGLTGQVDASGASSYYAFDASGNTTDLTGTNGAVVNSYTYLPYGQSTTAGSATNPFTFDGEDGVTAVAGSASLYLSKTRLYDASTGRFTQRDPLGFNGGSTNLYQYAGNDPVNKSDPSGETPLAVSVGEQAFLALFKRIAFDAEDLAIARVLGAATETNLLPAFLGGGSGLLAPGGTASILAKLDILDTAAAEAPLEFGAEIGGAFVYTTETQVLLNVSVPVTGVLTLTNGAALGLLGANVVANTATGLLAYTYEYNKENPNGTPLPEQEVLNGSTYQRIIKDPIVQSLIADYTKRNGEPPDADTITLYIQIAAQVNNETQTQNVTSFDPNEIIGPYGYGSQGFIPNDGQPLPYEIDFTNDATASAPAQVVTVTQTLSSNLDFSTFQFGNIGFGSTTVTVPAGLQSYSTTVSISSTLEVSITAAFDAATGIVTWTFTSLDPTTGDVPSNPLSGFLPPDVTAPEGEGYVSYTISPIASAVTGAVINAQASVVFDTNAPIQTTNIVNTIDAVAPTSTVAALAATQSSTYFTVNWSGSDDTGGSGLASYTILVSEDGGAFSVWLGSTTATSAVYLAQPGHTYFFQSIATDNAGNTQELLTTGQATTTVPAIVRTITFSKGKPASFIDAAGVRVVISLTGPGTGTLSFISTGNADPVSLFLSGTTTRSSISVHAARGTLTLGTVTVNGSLANFNAPHTSFLGTFTITGTLANLVLGDEAIVESTLSISSAAVPTSIRMGTVHDLVLTDAAAIKSLTVTNWTDGPFATDVITAPSIGAIKVTGNFDPTLILTGAALDLRSISVRGTLNGTWTVTGSIAQIAAGATASTWAPTITGNVTGLTVHGVMSGTFAAASLQNIHVGGNLSGATITLSATTAQLGKAAAINSITVAGSVLNSDIITQGNIRSVIAAGFSDSELFAGVVSGTSTLPTATSDFADTATISAVRSRGKTPFANTLIAAAAIGSVALVDATTANGGTPFGVATESLKTFSLSQPKAKPFSWNSKKAVSLLSTLPGDLHVNIL